MVSSIPNTNNFYTTLLFQITTTITTTNNNNKKRKKSILLYTTRWVGEGDLQKIEIWSYEQEVYAQHRIHPGEWDAQNSLPFWGTNRSPNLGHRTRPSESQQQQQLLYNYRMIFSY